MNYLLLITQAGAAIGSLLVTGVDVAVRIKHAMELASPDVKVNIHASAEQAIASDDETQQIINAFRAEQGLPPLTDSAV
jgi:hypothetical protein